MDRNTRVAKALGVERCDDCMLGSIGFPWKRIEDTCPGAKHSPSIPDYMGDIAAALELLPAKGAVCIERTCGGEWTVAFEGYQGFGNTLATSIVDRFLVTPEGKS